MPGEGTKTEPKTPRRIFERSAIHSGEGFCFRRGRARRDVEWNAEAAEGMPSEFCARKHGRRATVENSARDTTPRSERSDGKRPGHLKGLGAFCPGAHVWVLQRWRMSCAARTAIFEHVHETLILDRWGMRRQTLLRFYHRQRKHKLRHHLIKSHSHVAKIVSALFCEHRPYNMHYAHIKYELHQDHSFRKEFQLLSEKRAFSFFALRHIKFSNRC